MNAETVSGDRSVKNPLLLISKYCAVRSAGSVFFSARRDPGQPVPARNCAVPVRRGARRFALPFPAMHARLEII